MTNAPPPEADPTSSATDEDAWRRYSADLEVAMRRFDSSVALATARLRAERALSRDELRDALDDIVGAWRGRAEEMRVRLHLGNLDARDSREKAADELERATKQIGSVLGHLRSELGGSLGAMRGEARRAIDEAADILLGLRQPD